MALSQPIDTHRNEPVRTRRIRTRTVLGLALGVAALGGLGVAGWELSGARGTSAWNNPGLLATLAQPSATSSAGAAGVVTQGNLIATNAALASATAQLSALEQRLAELNQQAVAASGQATRAEALLVALAARRTIERGQPLGYLETQLRVRFGETEPKAVDAVIAAAQKPVTEAALAEEFNGLEPRLTGGPAHEGSWDWLKRQAGELFIIRHDDMPSPAPEARIIRARTDLAGGRVELAIAEVERLPSHDVANEWLSRARDWVAAQRALDQLESAALAAPTADAVLPASTVAPAATATPPASAATTKP